MLTSFFGKSKPINFILLSCVLLVGWFMALYKSQLTTQPAIEIIKSIGVYIGILFLMLLLDFVLRKNDLAKNNTYGVFLFSFSIIALPVVFLDSTIVITAILLLLSLRRIFSFSSERNIQKKILDASIYITVAGLFYFYALLFFIVLYIVLIRRISSGIKNLLIPVLGLASVFVLTTAFYYVTEDSFAWFYNTYHAINLDFTTYNSISILIPLTIIATCVVWMGTKALVTLPVIPKKERPNKFLLVLVTIVSILIVLLPEIRTGSEILLLIPACAMLFSTYVEQSKELIFKEIILWIFLVLPIVTFLIS